MDANGAFFDRTPHRCFCRLCIGTLLTTIDQFAPGLSEPVCQGHGEGAQSAVDLSQWEPRSGVRVEWVALPEQPADLDRLVLAQIAHDCAPAQATVSLPGVARCVPKPRQAGTRQVAASRCVQAAWLSSSPATSRRV
jgi:hypothetical protein